MSNIESLEEYLAEVRIILEHRGRFMDDYLEAATDDTEFEELKYYVAD